MKTVLITGAAQGIGLATARLFAAQGWFVGLYDLNLESIEDLLAEGGVPHACGGHCDVSDRASVAQALEHFGAHAGMRLDVLVNNAGVLSGGPFAALSAEHCDRMIDVNIRGMTQVAQLAFPLLSATPGATVVNLCSLSSVHGIPGLAVYSASKFYVNGLTEALALEWRAHGIRVTCVKPPLVNTGMGQAVSAGMGGKIGIDMEPEDVAQAILRAAHGRRTAYVLGVIPTFWSLLDRWLPERAREGLAGYLTGV